MWTCSRSLKTVTSWWSMSNGFNTFRHVSAHWALVVLNRMVPFCLFEAIANARLHPGKFMNMDTGSIVISSCKQSYQSVQFMSQCHQQHFLAAHQCAACCNDQPSQGSLLGSAAYKSVSKQQKS